MSSDSSQPERNAVSIGFIHNARIDRTLVGDHADVQLGVGQPASEPVLFSITDQDIVLPALCSPFVEHLLTTAGMGGFVYLGRYGRRIAGVVPADVLESMLAELSAEDDDAPAARTSTTPAAWAAWHRRHLRGQHAPPAGPQQQSLLQRAIDAGEVEPPMERGWPDIIPELADLPSLSDALIAARERERGR
jgi:hypothetical protein